MFLGFCAGLPSTRNTRARTPRLLAWIKTTISFCQLGPFSVEKANKWTVDMFPNRPLFQTRDLHPEAAQNYDFWPANPVLRLVSNVNFLDRKWSGGTFLTYHVISVIKVRLLTVIRTNSELCYSTIQALHTVQSSTASIVTSLQGKQKTVDGNIMSLNASLRTLHGNVGIDVAALNSSLMKLDQHVKNLNINVSKNTNGNNNISY